MKYFFVLGANPTLSLAEIYSLFGARADYRLLDKDCLLLETVEFAPQALINRLGGVIKIGVIVTKAMPADLLAAVKDNCRPTAGKKFFFGFSVFGKTGSVKILAMQLKKALAVDGVNSRWVVSRDKNLSSAAVEQSGLLQHGQEFVLIKDQDKILVGLTKAIQPFKDWSFRDYGRPERDDYSGMLPPKLARMMINLAKPILSEPLLDPFCGSGTVLNEAVLSGCSAVIGSDTSLTALENSKHNLAWLKEKYSQLDFRCQLFQCDARKLSEILDNHSVGCVVTEPYLGPARGTRDPKKIKRELVALYNEFLATVDNVLKPGGRAVMVWPIFMNGSKKDWLQPMVGNLAIVRPLPTALEQGGIKLSQRQTLIYGRPGQKIWREIVILVKK